MGEVSVFDPGAAVNGDVAVDVGTISDAGVTADCGITADACGFVDGGGFVNSGVSTDQCDPCDGGVIVGLGVVSNPAVEGKPVGGIHPTADVPGAHPVGGNVVGSADAMEEYAEVVEHGVVSKVMFHCCYCTRR